MCLGIPLLGVDETWKLSRIADEKDWSVIEHPIQVSFFSLDLDRESLHIQDSRPIVSQGMAPENVMCVPEDRGRYQRIQILPQP